MAQVDNDAAGGKGKKAKSAAFVKLNKGRVLDKYLKLEPTEQAKRYSDPAIKFNKPSLSDKKITMSDDNSEVELGAGFLA